MTRISSELKTPSKGTSSDGEEQKHNQPFHELLDGRNFLQQYEQYQRWLDHQAQIMAHTPEVASTFASALNNCY